MTASVDYTTGSGIAGGTLLDGWKGRLLKDWTFTAHVSTGSGLPVTPVYFAPVGGTGIIGSLRPDVTGVAERSARRLRTRTAPRLPRPRRASGEMRRATRSPARARSR